MGTRMASEVARILVPRASSVIRQISSDFGEEALSTRMKLCVSMEAWGLGVSKRIVAFLPDKRFRL